MTDKVNPEDPQQFRLYAAEAVVWPKRDRVILSLKECRQIVADIQATDWFQANYPRYLGPVPVRDGRGDKWSRVGLDGRSIHVLRKSRCKELVVHELSHVVCPNGVEDHGGVFAGMLLYMVGKVYGLPTKRKLRHWMRLKHVVYDRMVAKYGRVEP